MHTLGAGATGNATDNVRVRAAAGVIAIVTANGRPCRLDNPVAAASHCLRDRAPGYDHADATVNAHAVASADACVYAHAIVLTRQPVSEVP